MPFVVEGQAAVWQGYESLRRWWTGLWLGVIPLAMIFSLFFEGVLNALLYAYLLVFGILSVKLTSWPCPRCGKPFIRGEWGSLKFTSPLDLLSGRPCKHCGLIEGSDSWTET